MLLADEPNIREVIVFPLNQRTEDLLMHAPNAVDIARLKELHIKLDLPQAQDHHRGQGRLRRGSSLRRSIRAGGTERCRPFCFWEGLELDSNLLSVGENLHRM
ncbi:aspartyl-tRNA synthetase [Nitrospirillum viridazoti Y2]|uniref:Uncharacterized protein n=1 Tax=Nitrospirillum amazonense TaxID=28077 RepID=A0A560I7B9_9PROT|nr:aspartyl-tRNA synthetase [Nitrospirillum amazonense Y2]TWB54315.1 hypothetical protein FBZ92_11582 [Nitrospirillum amazonense]